VESAIAKDCGCYFAPAVQEKGRLCDRHSKIAELMPAVQQGFYKPGKGLNRLADYL